MAYVFLLHSLWVFAFVAPLSAQAIHITAETKGFRPDYTERVIALAGEQLALYDFQVVGSGGDLVMDVRVNIGSPTQNSPEIPYEFSVIVREASAPSYSRGIHRVQMKGAVSDVSTFEEMVAYEADKFGRRHGAPRQISLTGGQVTLMEATPIYLRLLQELSTAVDAVGDEVRLRVDRDVTVDGKVVVRKGQFVEAVITQSTKPGAGGVAGGIGFAIPMIWSVSEQPIPVASSTTYALGASGFGNMVVGSMMVGRWALLIRGEHAVIPPGQPYTVYVTKDRFLRL